MSDRIIYLRIAPFIIRIQSSISSVLQSIERLYQDCIIAEVSPQNIFADFHIRIARLTGLRRWFKPQVQFYFDGKKPFKPLPLSQAYPFFEWGLNWCISSHTYQYLLLHAAVVERNDKALILPGQPGAGKSTLCAALVCSGWRLLTDEMAIIDMNSKEIIPLVKPISLKNESITLIKNRSPHSIFGDSYIDTAKGTVAHLKPSEASIRNSTKRAVVSRIVFPCYLKNAKTSMRIFSKGQTVLRMAENSFNYNVLGNQAFDTFCDLARQSICEEFEYSDLDEAVTLYNDLFDA